MNIFIWCQYSNYDKNGVYSLHNDSNWNVMSGRFDLLFDNMRELDNIYINAPINRREHTMELLQSYKHKDKIKIINYDSPNHAFKVRYHFDYMFWEKELKDKNIDIVLCNDPMQVKNFKCLFKASYNVNIPIISYNHFIDNPSEPKVPKEIQYWYSQVSGAIAADLNLFTCRSTFDLLFKEMHTDFKDNVIHYVKSKSTVWDAGYSIADVEGNFDINFQNKVKELKKNKTLIFFPNRISVFDDYTNGKKFIELCNELESINKDFVVVFGNPSQKMSNDDIKTLCKPNIKISDKALYREEYRALLKEVDICVGLYKNDKYGGCSWREGIHAGALPYALNVYEYKDHCKAVKYPYIGEPDFNDIISKLDKLIKYCQSTPRMSRDIWNLKDRIINKCSYEHTIKKVIDDIRLVISGKPIYLMD